MRKLNNTLFVTSPDRYLALEGETVLVLEKDQKLGQFPLHNLESIVTFGYTGASPALMAACAQRNIALTFLSTHGRYLASVHGETKGNVLLRKQQYRLSDCEKDCLPYARAFLLGKLFNGRWVIERTLRDHAIRVDAAALKAASGRLWDSIHALDAAESIDTLRGIEGEAATRYFGVFDQMILQQKDAFSFQGRMKRPPTDNVNALLSFVYVLLTRDVEAALETVGLDPYVGFMHADRPGRASLAMDMVEELRAPIADRFVIGLINRRQVTDSGMIRTESGVVRIDDVMRKEILAAWQQRKQELLTHPYLGEKLEWGLIPYAQALLLSRAIRGDLDGYPPFLWK
ncbi:MAG: type I-C CRISPR-associated endonuclease Cas1c [Eubacteriales bacterium]|nr:type I-C CRISPR-associated endonuclease Cas1c [Eubacteriales bacterium]